MLLEQCAPLPFGHPTPDAELHPVVQRVGAAFRDDRTVPADRQPPCAARPRGQRVRRDQRHDIAPAIPMRCGLLPPRPGPIRASSLTLSSVGRDDYLTPAFPFVLATTMASVPTTIRYAIYATLCRLLLPISHCEFKLGGQVSFAQQFGTAFFGTTVPSGRCGLSFPDVCASHRVSRKLTHMPITLRKHAEAESPAPSSSTDEAVSRSVVCTHVGAPTDRGDGRQAGVVLSVSPGWSRRR